MKSLIFAVTLFVGSGAFAQFLKEGTITQVTSDGDYFSGGKNSRGHIYIVPNELNPESALPIFKKAPEGVYLSVGAERGLLGAILSPKVTHLIQMDLVPEVVMYNQINVVLLKVAKTLPDFLRLRTTQYHEQWQSVDQSGLNVQEKEILNSKQMFDFYIKVESGARERLIHKSYFKGSSYLKDPALFEKARAMAVAGRIQVLQGNLMDQARIQSLSTELAAKGLSLSLVDLSNAWEPKYIGPQGVDQVITGLSPALKDNSVVMGTSVAHCFESHLCLWDFRGFTFETLKESFKLYGQESPMSDLFLMKDSIAPNKILGKLGFLKLYMKGKPKKTSNSCQKIF